MQQYLFACALAIGCVDAPMLDATSSALATHYVTVNADGSFSPANLAIAEGDTVVFRGPLVQLPYGNPFRLPLRRTDSVVRVDLADLAANQSCLGSTLPYAIDNMLPGHDNELTGPLRRGASGIYALGPEENTGFYEGAGTDTCEAIGAANGAAPALVTEEWRPTVSIGPNQLCRKYVIENGKAAPTNSRFLLQSTWDNQSITGAVVRINWRDLYTITVSGFTEIVTLDYSKLDTELANAARRGKLVFLEILAGAGIPSWLFTDYAGDVDASAAGVVAKSVTPIYTSDFGSSSDTDMPRPHNCGYEKTMGSPADLAYRTALLNTLRGVAEHIRSSTLHYQALGSLKVTGLNFLTGEMRLPRRCLNTNDASDTQFRCWCNTRIWATPLGTQVAAYEQAALDEPHDIPIANGAGYTDVIAQNFMRLVEHTLYVALGRRKTMHFMLIQDGFPQVRDETHYDTEAPLLPGNDGYVNDLGNPINFSQQTKDALDSGQLGEFAQIDTNGVPLGGQDPDAGALFSPMHAGLGPKPAACNEPLPSTVIMNGKLQGVVVEPGVMSTNLNDYSEGGCPNKWATREGYEGQILGFQTQNDIDTTDAFSSLLWNATLNSNAVFIEAYESTLWRAEQERLGGNAVLSTVVEGYAEVPERQKSLAAWTNELHLRRRAISQFPAHAQNRHMKDPFPYDYLFTFKKDLVPNAVETYYFVNPAARCAAGTRAYGTIQVTGN
jgi:hypothetical protein